MESRISTQKKSSTGGERVIAKERIYQAGFANRILSSEPNFPNSIFTTLLASTLDL